MLLQVFLQGHSSLNRAVNEDVVAVEMLPESQWSCPSSWVLEDEAEKGDEDADKEVICACFICLQNLPTFCIGEIVR